MSDISESAKTLDNWNLEDRVSTYLRAILQPLPLLAGLTALGFIIIFALGRTGIFEPLATPILSATAILLMLAGLQLLAVNLARRGRGLWSLALYAISMPVAGVALTLVWQGLPALAILMAWLAPGTTFTARIPRRDFWSAAGLSAVASAAILWFEARPILPRLQTNSTSSFAALLLLASMVLLFALVTVATQIIRYRTLQTRLVGSIIPLVAVPILFTTSIAAYNAVSSNQQQLRSTLEAVTALKRRQSDALIQTLFSELATIQDGSGDASSIFRVLDRTGEDDATFRLNQSIAATLIRNVIALHPVSRYEEVFVMDNQGNVVLSTYLLDQGTNFGQQEFFQRGLTGNFTQYTRFPGRQNAAGEYRLVMAAPFFGTSKDDIRGVVAAVARGEVIQNIMSPTAGLGTENTYLVDTEFHPVTQVAASDPALVVTAPALVNIVRNRAGGGSSTYVNHAGLPVLGFYEWDFNLNAAVVSEVPQSVLVSRALAALLASALVGLLTIIIAIIAVLASARAISEPVSGLAGVAEHLATGHLTTRARTDREDEIGRLANAFNAMANQLQSMIGGLERRVAERTRDLEQQTFRLRTAAGVARDAALAPSLDELLSRAARLILERFEHSHVGIFLLDERKQFAVLQAAPSEAGQRMLSDNYRVRVGEAGVVGRVAVSGQAVLVPTSGGPEGMGDTYHPETRAELAVPLRTNEGIIGVLDLQSDQADAFAATDIDVMQVLADQLAGAIERGRLLLRVQERLGQLEQTYRTFTDQSWGAYGRERRPIAGYRYDNVRLDPVHALSEEARAALESGTTMLDRMQGKDSDGRQTAAVPIRVRGRTLGIIHVNFQHGRAPSRTIAMIEQAADRLGTALENVRLLEDSLRRAGKERLISEITGKIGSSMNMRNLLQTAVEELGRALPGSEVSIDFAPASGGAEKDR